MKPNKLVFLLAGLLVFAFCALSFPCAGAEDNACSLTLQCTYEDGGSKTALAGDTYSIAKIASARVTGAEGKPLLQYTLLPAYQSFDCDWGALTSMQLREKAMAIYEAVEKSKDYPRGRLCLINWRRACIWSSAPGRSTAAIALSRI